MATGGSRRPLVIIAGVLVAAVVVAFGAIALVGAGPDQVHPPAPIRTGVPAAAGGPVGVGGSVATTRLCAPRHFSLEPVASAATRARHLAARMTLSQEVDLMHGVGIGGSTAGTAGSTAAIPALKVPSLNQEDGPAGVGDGDTGVTQLPAPIALAATFDPAAARCYGQVIGHEARGKGVNLVYGPTVNLVRVPQWGRAFESFGEDPDLSGTVAEAEIGGIQSAGVMAQVKHFAVYNQEEYRNTPADDAVVAERVLEETYLKVWRMVAAASPAAIMCSYSTINGVPACQDSALMQGFLRGQAGFTGFIGSDYNATHSTVASVRAGLDQEQPTDTYFGPPLLRAVRTGAVSRAVIDRAAVRILTQMYRFRMFGDDPVPRPHRDVASAADGRVARAIAEEGTVLLKDGHAVLPLTRHGSVGVIGAAAGKGTVTSGAGSAAVISPGSISPIAGIRAAAPHTVAVSYTSGLPTASAFAPIPAADLTTPYPPAGSEHPFTTTLTAPETGTYVFGFTSSAIDQQVTLSIDGAPLISEAGIPPIPVSTASVHFRAGSTHTLTISGPSLSVRWVTPSALRAPIAAAAAAAARATTAVVVVGDGQESEGADRASLALPGAQDALVRAVAAVNPRTVVVVEAGAAVAMPWLSRVAAVVDQWYPGQSDGASLAAVLFGAVNPSGHLPVTFPRTLAETPVSGPGRYPGVAGRVDYTEGTKIGYRWWQDTGHRPLFPFGFGLSYTTFRYGRPVVAVSMSGGAPVVSVREAVTNTGDRAGADVAQVYLKLPAGAGEAGRTLAAYQRVNLHAGQRAVVSMRLRGLTLASFRAGRWRIAAGRFLVSVGDSSAVAARRPAVAFRLARGYVLSATPSVPR
jgi:beta-glucosidase